MIISFFGHRDTTITSELRTKIKETITKNLHHKKAIFYCGGYGTFDTACAEIVKELKLSYFHIESLFVTPYVGNYYNSTLKLIQRSQLYDGILYPELETVPLKFAIPKRNEFMILQSDLIIAYVDHNRGGAFTALKYALRKKKKIINLAPQP